MKECDLDPVPLWTSVPEGLRWFLIDATKMDKTCMYCGRAKEECARLRLAPEALSKLSEAQAEHIGRGIDTEIPDHLTL